MINTGLEGKLDELRKGRSLVLEQDHTIIFNWSPSIFDVISELVIANESRRKPRIVVMADRDKVEMEDEIAAKVPASQEHPDHLPQRRSDRPVRHRHRQSADRAVDHHPLAGETTIQTAA